jgi:hypothetical protein
VLGVVVDGTVDGDGADVDGAGAGPPPPLPSLPSSPGVDGGGGEGCDGDGGLSSTSETSALGGGVETWGPSDEGGVAPAAPVVAVGVVFGRGLEASPESRMSTVTLTNPARNATTHAAAMNSLCMREEPPLSELSAPDVCSGGSVETGGVACSCTNASRTVAGEIGTLGAFRNPSPAKRVPSAESAADGAFELALGHPGAALDVLLAGLLVELVPGAPARAPVRSHPTAASG